MKSDHNQVHKEVKEHARTTDIQEAHVYAEIPRFRGSTRQALLDVRCVPVRFAVAWGNPLESVWREVNVPVGAGWDIAGKLLSALEAAATAATILSLASPGTVDKKPILGGSCVG